MTPKPKRPRSRVCWLCGNKLYGNHFAEMVVDQHPRILHKACKRSIDKKEDLDEIMQRHEEARDYRDHMNAKEKK